MSYLHAVEKAQDRSQRLHQEARDFVHAVEEYEADGPADVPLPIVLLWADSFRAILNDEDPPDHTAARYQV